ncbi:MAG: TonB-dependent receptor plug domain-containing protein [Flammeovirgaceae bacterium]
MKKNTLFATLFLLASTCFSQNAVTVSGQDTTRRLIVLQSNQPKPLFILDDVELIGSDIGKLDPKDVETIEVVKGPNALEKYGKKGKDGVVIIFTKAYKEKKRTEAGRL